jgi:hypothetical protein
MLREVQQQWAGVLGRSPADGSPLALDLAKQDMYATDRRPRPMEQARWYAQTFGLIAHNHLEMLEEALINYANGTGKCPITTVETLTRVALEALSRQGWLCHPKIDQRTRFRRLCPAPGVPCGAAAVRRRSPGVAAPV